MREETKLDAKWTISKGERQHFQYLTVLRDYCGPIPSNVLTLLKLLNTRLY